MLQRLFLLLITVPPLFLQASAPAVTALADDCWKTPYEHGDGWETAEYQAGIAFYRRLTAEYARVQMRAAGQTDSGFPLHVVTVSEDGRFDIAAARAAGRSILLINNAIHPGESDGVDASMMLVRDLAQRGLPENVIVAVIPFYNIGGALDRNSVTRVNQNGPREYGFRGNARNYDLNRDFIKCDTKNALSFASVFQELDPDLLIDTHVSNGADYQYVMTSAHSQKDKLGMELGKFFEETFQPQLFGLMKASGFETIPYVNSGGLPPDDGYVQFLDTPRYSTGYAALFQTMGFMTETHMLKPYPQRVKATRAFLDAAVSLLSKHGAEIRKIRQRDRGAYARQASVPIAWEIDRDRPSKLRFLGYEATRKPSRVTAGERLFYDRTKPFTKLIEFYGSYRPSQTVTLPAGYLVPRGWHRVIKRLQANGVHLFRLKEEASLRGEIYRIERVETRERPYEGHFVHDSLELSVRSEEFNAQIGDYVIPIQQQRARYIVETLEPAAVDSFFRWNFFDTVLAQKEHFSPYVFEDLAEQLLAEDVALRKRFTERKATDPEFAADRGAQLQFIYEQSPHHEGAHRTYPVVRLVNRDQVKRFSVSAARASDTE